MGCPCTIPTSFIHEYAEVVKMLIEDLQNPYPEGSISNKIYENNYIDPGDRITSACYKDKFIIYLYVMGRTIKQIAEFMELHPSTISNKLDKYEVKIK